MAAFLRDMATFPGLHIQSRDVAIWQQTFALPSTVESARLCQFVITRSFDVPTIDDTDIEPGPNETFQIDFSDPVGATIGTPSFGTAEIMDNDSDGVQAVWVVGVSSAEEGVEQGHFQIHRSIADGPLTVNLHWDTFVAPTDALDPLLADSNDIALASNPNIVFSGTSGTVTFGSTDLVVDLFFDAIEDGVDEVLENFYLFVDPPEVSAPPAEQYVAVNGGGDRFVAIADTTPLFWRPLIVTFPFMNFQYWIAVKKGADLKDLATFLSDDGDNDDWTVLWPHDKGTSLRAWDNGAKYPSAAERGAIVDTGNVHGFGSRSLHLRGKYIAAARNEYPVAMRNYLQQFEQLAGTAAFQVSEPYDRLRAAFPK